MYQFQRNALVKGLRVRAISSRAIAHVESLLPLGTPSVLPAASPRFPKAREPWKPRPGDGISPDWLIAELTHRQAHGLKLQYRSLPRADTHVP